MKKLYCLFLSLFIFCLSVQPASAASKLQLHSEFAYLYDPVTDIVYIDQKSNEKIYPASMTKILTVSLALEKIKDMKEKVRVAYSDLAGLEEADASTAGFYENELVTYEDLLYGALLPSGADACHTLGRLLYGSTENMVKAMNQKVKELHLKNTHFTNVTGLHDDDHYTTAKEMGFILEDALQNKDFVKIFNARKYTTSSKRLTWNSSLQRAAKKIDTSMIDGGKSGFTYVALLTFASTMTIDNHQLIFITAKADGQYSQNNVKDIITVYNYMNEHYKNYIAYRKDEEIYKYFVMNTFDMIQSYQAYDDISLLIDKTYQEKDISVELTKDSFLFATAPQGQTVGQVDIKYKDQSLYQTPLTLNKTVDKSVLAMIVEYGFILLMIGFIVLRSKLIHK